MKVIVNKDICIGCTLCVQSCPGVFRMEQDKAIVHLDSVTKEFESCSRQAADECPVTAITIE